MTLSEILSIVAILVSAIIGVTQIIQSRKLKNVKNDIVNINSQIAQINSNNSGVGIIGSSTGNIIGNTITGNKQRSDKR